MQEKWKKNLYIEELYFVVLRREPYHRNMFNAILEVNGAPLHEAERFIELF